METNVTGLFVFQLLAGALMSISFFPQIPEKSLVLFGFIHQMDFQSPRTIEFDK